MVFYFKSNVVDPPALLYMGKDKFENEELIRWGWPEDVWFHVDDYSSAHVYLRLEKGQTIDDIPADVLTDCAQLVKANSIHGNKLNNIHVVYTMWANLKKTAGMAPGQVAYHVDHFVKKIRVDTRIGSIVNRLNRTKTEEYPDLRTQREERDAVENREKKHQMKLQMEKEKIEQQQRDEEAKLRSYTTLMQSEKMKTNQDDGNDSDDFW